MRNQHAKVLILFLFSNYFIVKFLIYLFLEHLQIKKTPTNAGVLSIVIIAYFFTLKVSVLPSATTFTIYKPEFSTLKTVLLSVAVVATQRPIKS